MLTVVCDAKYKFTLVDIGDTGKQSDGSVYTNSHLGYAIEYGLFNIPQPSKLPQSERILPYVFVGDDAFGLKNHLMKPYPFQNLSLAERVFNGTISPKNAIFSNSLIKKAKLRGNRTLLTELLKDTTNSFTTVYFY